MTDYHDRRLAAALAEYEGLQAENRLRIDLQHRNMNVLLVLVTAASGYLASYASQHGVEGPKGLLHNDIAVVVVLVPIVINAFIWRHLDHDINIIDKADYVFFHLRPLVLEGTDSRTVLNFERFIHARRQRRFRRALPTINLGKEDLPMFIFLAIYVAGAWYTRLVVRGYAGGGETLFAILLYIASGLTIISLAMAVSVAREYRRLGSGRNV